MKWLFLGLFGVMSVCQAEMLSVGNVEYIVQPGSPSCKILRHRAKEREKVLRESAHEKHFLDREQWTERTSIVQFSADLPYGFDRYVIDKGLSSVLFRIRGPGIHWKSYATQPPEDLFIELDWQNRRIHVEYKIYQSEICAADPLPPVMEWIRD